MIARDPHNPVSSDKALIHSGRSGIADGYLGLCADSATPGAREVRGYR
jgi:hypothetical protein